MPIGKTDFTGFTKTKTGIETKDVRWNGAAGKYLGMIKDPKSILIQKGDREWVTCTWTKGGKCVNQNRSEFDLK